MAVTLGSTGITFPDATTQTTAATGGGAIQATFTAAAAITAGQTVQFTTGTNVTPVTGTVYNFGLGSRNTVLSTGNEGYNNTNSSMTVAYDPNTVGSFVAVSRSSSTGNLTIVAGTTSSDTTTVGSVVTVALAGTSNQTQFFSLKAMFDPVTPGKVLVMALDATAANGATVNLVKAWMFSVSGTTVTLQSNTTVATITGGSRCTFSYYGQDRFVYAYASPSTAQIYGVACSISSYTITQGAATSLVAVTAGINSDTQALAMDYSPLVSNTLGLSYINNSNNDGFVLIFTVNPTTKVLTAGSPSVIIAGTYAHVSITFDPFVSTRFVASSAPQGSASSVIYAFEFSGTTISNKALVKTIPIDSGSVSYLFRGLAVKFLAVGSGASLSSVLGYTYTALNLVDVGCCIQVQFYDQNWGTGVAAGTAYNSAFTFAGESAVFSSSTGVHTMSVTPLSNVSGQAGKTALPYGYVNGTIGYLRLGQATATATNLDSTKIIGIANASASASASVVVNLWGGISTNQSGLTPNTTYYVDQTGALTTASTAPNVSMGKALTASTILLKTTP